jgi:hypothetical protein
MNTAALQATERSGTGAEKQSLPMSRDNQENDSFVELKWRSLENFATAAMARKIGYFSIALGLAEVLMPAQLGELSGIGRSKHAFLQVLGAREIAHGVGILAKTKPTAAMMTRIGGDAVDLAFLGIAFAAKDSNKRRLIGATAAVLGVTALDIICSKRLSSHNWSRARGNPAAPSTTGQPSGRNESVM